MTPSVWWLGNRYSQLSPFSGWDGDRYLKDLTLVEEYLAMQDAIGNETRFRILYALKQQGEMSANQLKESLGMRPNNLHYHLDKLCDVGLVQNRKQNTPDSDGLFSYYVASGMGKAILEHGVEELMRREREFKDRQSS